MTSSEEKASTKTALLSNRYRILSVLGDGGFGKTFLVEDVHMPSARRCVLKQLKPVEDDPHAEASTQDSKAALLAHRFSREAATLEKLGETHDQIPRLYAYFSEDDQFYLVTEWIAGQTLSQQVQAEGPQSEAVVKKIVADLLEVITYVHRQGIVHRDIKPDNVILRRPDGKPVLIDFGAVKETMTTQLSEDGQASHAHTIAIGTPGYMPAEQMSGRPTFASDLYSLGMTAIFLLTGRIPQELGVNDNTGEWLWRQYVPSISAGFGNFLDCAIHRDPRTRFPSADSMLSILKTLIADDETRTVAGFDLSTPAPEPTLAPPLNQQDIPDALYAQQDPTYEVPYELTENVPPASRPSSWRNAVLIGALVGFSALMGVLLAMERLPNVFARFTQQSEQIDPIENTPEELTDPIEPDPPARRTTTPNANSTVAGLPGSKNVRAQAGTIYAVVASVDVGDRVQVTQRGTDADGNAWYQITTPDDKRGWIAGQLLQIDGNAGRIPQLEEASTEDDDKATDDPNDKTGDETDTDENSDSTDSGTDAGEDIDTDEGTDSAADKTNAVLVGEAGSKNIRAGAGIAFAKVHEAFPGDRVIITDTRRDTDGYTWYKVSFPESGAEGWIAAQLVKRD